MKVLTECFTRTVLEFVPKLNGTCFRRNFMDESTQELEHFLIQTSSNDNEEIHIATEYIVNALKEPTILEKLFSIINFSIEPIAIAQAIIQITSYTKLNWRVLDINSKHSIVNFFLNCLITKKFNGSPLDQIIGAISFFLYYLTSPWDELIQYLLNDQEDDELFAIKLKIFVKALHLFDDDQINENLELFCQFCIRGLQLDNWNARFDSLRIIDKLIQLNEEVLALFVEIISQITQEIISEPNVEIQKRFFDIISFIVKCGEQATPIIENLVEVCQNQEISPIVALSSINAMEDIVTIFDEEQRNSLLLILLNQMARFIESFEELPTDYIDFVGSLFSSFNHAELYGTIKQLICEGISQESGSFAIASILFILPVLDYAPEVFHGEEIEFVSSLIKAGFEIGISLSIQSICHVINSASSIHQLEVILPQFITNFVEIITSHPEDYNLIYECYDSLDVILSKKISHSDETFLLIWNMREQIDQSYVSKYFLLLRNCIEKSSNSISSDVINTVFEFINPFLSEPIQDLDLASNCLRIVSAIISKEEEQADKLEICLPATTLCFQQIQKLKTRVNKQEYLDDENDQEDYLEQNEDDESLCNCLEFLKELSIALHENAVPFISNFIPNILKLIKKRNNNISHLIWDKSMQALCSFIKYSHTTNILKQITKVLLRGIKSIDDENELNYYILFVRMVVQFLDNKKKLSFFKRILKISRTCQTDDLLGTCFLCMKKIIKYSTGVEELQTHILQKSFSLCSHFISGDLPALGGKQINAENDDENGEIFSNLCEDFAEFVSQLVGMSQEIVDEITELFISVASSKQSETYNSILLSVFIGIIEKETYTETSLQRFFEIFPSIIELSSPNYTQQDIIYIINLLLNKLPEIILEKLQQMNLLERILSWFSFTIENKVLYGDLLSNISSLLINLANHHFPGLDISNIKQALCFYPPDDETEALSMSNYLITFIQQNEIDSEMQILISNGLAKILTQNQSKLNKMKITEELFTQLVAIFKQLCSNEDNLQNAIATINGSQAKLAKLQSLLQS